MKHSILSSMVFALAGLAACAQAEQSVEPVSTENTSDAVARDIAFTGIQGEAFNLSDYKGKVLLVVNTASKCGYTPQYEGLQTLWEEHKDEGLVVIGMPSGDFGNQELDNNTEVKRFCEVNYGVDFPLTEKTHVTGADRHDFFAYAEDALGQAAIPQWNFHKVIVNKEGIPVATFPSKVKPGDEKILSTIEGLL